MEQSASKAIVVSHSSDAGAARQAMKTMAEELGFDEKATEEIAIAVSELSSNLVEHARGGTITLTPLRVNGRVGIQIDSADSGPGIADIDQAMTDGFSTKGGLGYGLGAINRLMHEFEIQSQPGQGTHITSRRWVRSDKVSVRPPSWEFGVATRPHPQMDVCGDAFVVKQWDESALVAVIDGVGHGPPAYQAAQVARHYIENHYDQPLAMIFHNVGYTCRATRGVVMAVARFDQRPSRLVFASIGNIEARLFGSRHPVNFMVRRGLIGYNAPRPVVTEHPWESDNMLILHTDGVGTSWRLEDFPNLIDKPGPVMAQGLLRALNRGNDDATVVVVRGGVP